MDQAGDTFANLTSKYPRAQRSRSPMPHSLREKGLCQSGQIAAQLTKSDGGDPEVQVLNALLLLNNGKSDDAFTLLKQAAKDNSTISRYSFCWRKSQLPSKTLRPHSRVLEAAAKNR